MFAFKALLVMLIMAFAAVPVTIASRLIAAGGLPAGGQSVRRSAHLGLWPASTFQYWRQLVS